MRALATVILTASMLSSCASLAIADDTSRAKAEAALAVCDAVEHMPPDRQARIDRLDKGVAIAEEAVKADDGDGRAHFALFCNVAKRVSLAGLSWRVLGELRRSHQEIDRAHELAPNDPDVLIAKGEFLRRLPGALGGDKPLGLRLLHRALEIKPDHVLGRLYLARALADDGVPEARAEAYEALALAKKAGDAEEQAEAQRLIVSLQD
jgi:tetratricopeptide (TPR) repeat protein